MRPLRLWAVYLAIPIAFSIFVYQATRAPLPTTQHPIKFYSNQTRQDLKLTFLDALRSAKHSITLYTYGLTDPHVIDFLNAYAAEGKSVTLILDRCFKKKAFHPNIQIIPLKTRGLMHEKILIIDDHLTMLGSANLTTSSLTMHDNLVLGIESPELARFFSDPKTKELLIATKEKYLEIHRLPDQADRSLSRLITAIDKAQTKIDVAQFTFTHAEITESLIRAHERGVRVTVAVDSYTARGASRKVVKSLREAKVPLKLSTGVQLLHYKWANIDNQILILGSTNWTKGAFKKNQDTLIFLYPLTSHQIKFINNLFNIIINEAS